MYKMHIYAFLKQESTSKRRNPSGPAVSNPYEDTEASNYLPVLVAIGAAVPILVCLCKI